MIYYNYDIYQFFHCFVLSILFILLRLWNTQNLVFMFDLYYLIIRDIYYFILAILLYTNIDLCYRMGQEHQVIGERYKGDVFFFVNIFNILIYPILVNKFT
jgi:hypothetical protein